MTPFVRGVIKPRTAAHIAAAAESQGISTAEAEATLTRAAEEGQVYINDIYQVQVHEIDSGFTHLNIRRRDGKPIFRDWRHFQQIKNELCGPEREGFEIYPSESRLVDSSNKYHIYVAPEGVKFPLGWQERDVRDDDGVRLPGMRQRPFAKD